jgi:hypothetical protein
MANPTDLTVRGAARGGAFADELDTIRAELNKNTTVLRILTAKLDADAGVTDTNYAALVTDASVPGPAKINVVFG